MIGATLALATALRYATRAGQGKKSRQQHNQGSSEPFLTNRLAPFYSATLAQIPAAAHSCAMMEWTFSGATIAGPSSAGSWNASRLLASNANPPTRRNSMP